MTTKVTSLVLANTAVTAGTYGGSSAIPVVTVDAQGRLTSAANVSVTQTAVYGNTGQITANTATGVVAVGLASSGAIAGSYGSGTQTPIITVDAFGRITSVSTTTITGGSAGIGATTYNRQSYTPTAGQTVFTVSGGYTVGFLQVYVNGVLLNTGDYTATNGTSFTLATGALLGDTVESLAYTTNVVLNVSPSPSGGLAGQVLYQSAANTTANTDVGTAGYLLTSQGSGKPTWSAQTSLVIANTQLTGTITAGQLGTTSNPQFNSVGVGTAASTTSGEIRATNNITAYYSDDRLKTKLGNIENALEKIKTLTGFYYHAKEIAESFGYTVQKEVGVSAQEVQKILPEVVVPAPIDDKYLTVRYEKLIPLIIEAIKDLDKKIDDLKGSNK